MFNNTPFKLLYNNLFVINRDKIEKMNIILDNDLVINRFEVNNMDKERSVLLHKKQNNDKIDHEKQPLNIKEKVILLNEFRNNNDVNKLNIISSNYQDFNTLVNDIKNCYLCNLSTNRKNAILYRGSIQAPWFVIGESPNEEDETNQQPFSGEAGLLLNKMLQAINIDVNQDAYITNIVKCKTDKNLNPTLEQLNACKNYLVNQIRLVKPKIILSLGKDLIDLLLYNKLPISKVRGNIYYFENIPIVVTFTPAYLLRNTDAKKLAWQDLQLALKIKNERE
jgi:uracil-DNA glycosylase family 4